MKPNSLTLPLSLAALLPLLILIGPSGLRAEEMSFALDHPRLQLKLGADARWREVSDKASGRSFVFSAKPVPFAKLRRQGREHASTGVERRGDELRIRFGDGLPLLRCGLTPNSNGTTFRLLGLEGRGSAEVDRIEFLRLPVTLAERVGRHLGVVWNEDFAICVAGGSLRTDAGAQRAGDHALLVARAHRDTGFEGAEAAILAGAPGEMRTLLRNHAQSSGLPQNEGGGIDSKDMPAARASYWFLSGIGEKDAERLIALGNQSGIRQVLLSQCCWAATTGHYRFNENRFPRGLEGLTGFVSKLHDAGFLVGMHTFVSKVSKNDPFVTPVPDRRFWTDATAALAAPVDEDATEIPVKEPLAEWPASPLCKKKVWEGGIAKHRDLVIGNEIVQYDAVSEDGRRFLGCRRGAYGTDAASHAAGAPIRHYGVDGCIDGYIIDQETTLLGEVAGQNAAIFNAAGFDMVYFDGGEDVPRPHYWHYCTRFQDAALSRYQKRPLIHMGTVMTHLLWHSFTRSGTVDTYLNTLHGAIIAGAPPAKWPTVREHIDRSVKRVIDCQDDLMPGELGWFGIWPKGEGTDGLQMDEAEYLLAKSLAYDAPVSLQTTFKQMDAHPLTSGILDLVRVYEGLRLSGTAAETDRARLRETGKDFLLVTRGERREFVEVRPAPVAGGTGAVRAMAGKLAGKGAVASLWHVERTGELRLEPGLSGARLFDVDGREIALRQERGVLVVPVGPQRNVLVCEKGNVDELSRRLATAQCAVKPPRTIWVRASEFVRSQGGMTTGIKAGLADEGTLSGDFIVCAPAPGKGAKIPAGSCCEYEVEVPRAGQWSVWARLRYPTGGDLSFALVPDGEGPELSGDHVLGNSGMNGGVWHWDGQGSGTASKPGQTARRLWLKEGKFVFRIHPRETAGRPETNPRLDLICLSEDPTYRPSDADAHAAMGQNGDGRSIR